jgi:hypothetical protein
MRDLINTKEKREALLEQIILQKQWIQQVPISDWESFKVAFWRLKKLQAEYINLGGCRI